MTYYKPAGKDDGVDFRNLLKHREHAKNKLEGESGEKVDLKHGLCLSFSRLLHDVANAYITL